jgi:hypothetical protein
MPSILDPETERAEMIVPMHLGDPRSPLDEGPVIPVRISYPVGRWPWTDPAFVENAAKHGVYKAAQNLKDAPGG